MLDIKGRGGRKLTQGEVSLLSQIFATGLTFNLIRIHKGYHPDLTDEQVDDIKGRSHAFQNDIYLVGNKWSEDLAKDGDVRKLGTLVHEAVHIWQYQNNISLGGIEILDNYHREEAEMYGRVTDSLGDILESGVDYYQKKYRRISDSAAVDSVKAAIPSTVREYKENEKLYYYHRGLKKQDKSNYASRDNWDPVYNIPTGPRQEGEGLHGKYLSEWTLPQSDDPLLAGLELDARPKVGE